MPIFISYSRKDSAFVEVLAANLVRNRHNVWLDKWELSVGDLLIDKIQSALTESSAVILVLSKNSIDSAWCKKELNAILMRELAEKKSILIPCVIDDCEIPLFVQEKLYADFRADKDEGFSAVDKALAKISNPHQGRIEEPDFHVDWSVAYGNVEGRDIAAADRALGILVKFIELTFVEHAEKWPYIVMCQWVISFRLDPITDKNIFANRKTRDKFIHNVVRLVVASLEMWNLKVLIEDGNPVKEFHRLKDKSGTMFEVELVCRRFGEDNGMITLFHTEEQIKGMLRHMDSITKSP